jgi:hypothetical protein
LKPEKANWLGPTTEAAAPEDPVLEVPLPLVVEELVPEVVEDPVPEEPVLEVPVPEPVDELLPELPVLEVPLPEVVDELPPELVVELAPEDPLWAGWNGMVPPPHPARIRSANNRTLALSMKNP